MDPPVVIGNVHNMTLERLSDKSDEHPHLVAQFSCETNVGGVFYITSNNMCLVGYIDGYYSRSTCFTPDDVYIS